MRKRFEDTLSPERCADLQEALEQGRSCAYFKAAFGLDPSKVSRIRKRMGTRPVVAERLKDPQRMIDNLMSLQDDTFDEQLEKLGVSRNQLQRLRRKAGLGRKHMTHLENESAMTADTQEAAKKEFMWEIRHMAIWELKEKYPELTSRKISYYRKQAGLVKPRWTTDMVVRACADRGWLGTINGKETLIRPLGLAASELGIHRDSLRAHLEKRDMYERVEPGEGKPVQRRPKNVR